MSFDPKKVKKSKGVPQRRGRIRSEATLSVVQFAEHVHDTGNAGEWYEVELPGVSPNQMGQVMDVASRHIPDDIGLEYRTIDGVVHVYAVVQPF